MLLSLLLAAANVTDAKSLEQSVIAYLAGREDLSKTEHAEWEKAVRITFGGSALKTGLDDPGVTAAKSVLSFGIFNHLPPAQVAAAAYDAKNDVYAQVPAPMAIKYQTMKLEGRTPKESARTLAFNFSRNYDEELAPEMIGAWKAELASGNSVDPDRVRRQMADTLKIMGPRLRKLAWEGAVLQADVRAGKVTEADAAQAFAMLRQDLNEDPRDYYELYARLCRDAGVAAQAKPVATPPVRPSNEAPAVSAPGKTGRKPPKNPTSATPPARPAPEAGEPTAPETAEPPRAGDTLCEPPSEFDRVFNAAVGKWLGTPYLWGGTTKAGIDCSAFSREVYRDTVRVELPRVAGNQYRTGIPLDSAQLKRGDLVFFDTLEKGRITHVGVFDGSGVIVHATCSRGVARDKLAAAWLQRAYRGSRRLIR